MPCAKAVSAGLCAVDTATGAAAVVVAEVAAPGVEPAPPAQAAVSVSAAAVKTSTPKTDLRFMIE